MVVESPSYEKYACQIASFPHRQEEKSLWNHHLGLSLIVISFWLIRFSLWCWFCIFLCPMFPLDYIWLNCCILNLLEFVAVQNGAMGHVIRSSACNTWGPGKKKWGLTHPIRITLMDRWKLPDQGVPSPSLTWNLKMMLSKRNLLFQGAIYRFYVTRCRVTFPNEKPEFYWKIKWLFGNKYSTFPVSASSFLVWQTEQFGLETSKHIKSTSSNIHFIFRKQLIYIYIYQHTQP